MKRKIHIDELFKNGLKNLSLLVSSKDFEAITKKQSMFNDSSDNVPPLFDEFELEVTDQDWANTWSKFQHEKQQIDQRDPFKVGLSQLELTPHEQDWPTTYAKYKDAKRRRKVWWFAASSVALLFTIGALLLMQSLWFKSAEPQLSIGTQQAQQLQVVDKQTSQTYSNFKPVHSAQTPVFTQATSKAQSPIQSKVNLKTTSTVQGGSSMQKVREAQQVKPINPIQSIPSIQNTPALAGLRAVTPAELVNEPALTVQMVNLLQMPLQASEMPAFLEQIKDFKHLPLLAKLPAPIRHNKWQYYVAIHQSAAYNKRLLSSVKQPYVDLRNLSDQVGRQFATGFEFGAKLKNTQINIGVSSVQQHERSRFQYQYEVYDSIPVWNPGRTQIVGYFLVNPRDTVIDQSTHILRQHIQVPFKVAQFIQVNPKTAVGFELGATLQYTVSSKGNSVLNPENNILYPYSHFKDDENLWQFYPSVGLSCQQELKKRIAIQATAFGQFGISNQYKMSFNAQQHNYQYGLNLKLLYLLK